jgi:LPXTG-motif cell wall-anchored protein
MIVIALRLQLETLCASRLDGKRMRRITVLIATLSFAMSGLVFSPAQAAVPSNGTYLCKTGVASSATPNFTITDGVVSAGGSCIGDVVIPDGVIGIGGWAFGYASSLTSITLPEGLVSIGAGAFQDQLLLTSLTIPASVTDIGYGAFRFAGLTSITVETGNANYTSTSGVLFNKASTTLIAYPANKNITTYSIPETVTSIVTHAFSDANLISITIPSGVTGIGAAAFESTDITTINIPANVVSIGEFAFYNTFSLSSITVDQDNSHYSSFDGVFFNEAVTTLIACPSQKVTTSYSIPETVTRIEPFAFSRSTLTSITIPETVTSIGNGAFFSSRLSSVTIPSGVTSIESDVFADARYLTSVTIPSSVISIAGGAFRYTSLTSVYFLGDAPATGSSTPFGDIPVGAKAYIKFGASGFGNLGSIWNGLIVTLDVASEVTQTTTPTPIESAFNSPEVLAKTGIATQTNSLGAIGLGLLAILLGSIGLLRRNS